VDPGNIEIANQAAQLLMQKSDQPVQKGKTYLLEPKLIVRNSSKSLVRNN
jgi:DNA-binding LacI/PurR family transcriptional regulator